jgi:hypothetical protein
MLGSVRRSTADRHVRHVSLWLTQAAAALVHSREEQQQTFGRNVRL